MDFVRYPAKAGPIGKHLNEWRTRHPPVQAVKSYLFEFRDLELDERGRCRRALVDGRPDEPIAPRSVVVRWDGS